MRSLLLALALYQKRVPFTGSLSSATFPAFAELVDASVAGRADPHDPQQVGVVGVMPMLSARSALAGLGLWVEFSHAAVDAGPRGDGTKLRSGLT